MFCKGRLPACPSQPTKTFDSGDGQPIISGVSAESCLVFLEKRFAALRSSKPLQLI